MADEKPDEKGDVNADVTQPGDVEIKAVPKAAEPAKEAKPGEEQKPTTLDIVKAKREEQRQGRAKDTAADKKAAGADNAGSEKSEAEGAEADAGSDLKGKGDEKSGEGDEKALKLSDIDTSKPGWFDRLTKEQQKALAAEQPDVVRIINAGKSEAQRYIETAKKKADTKSAKPADDQKPAATTDEAEPDITEAIDLLYNKKTKKEGLTRLLSDPDAQAIIDDRVERKVKEVLKHIGADVDEYAELQPFVQAIELASTKYPQLKDDETFFDEAQTLLQEDEETYDAITKSKDSRLIAAALREASAQVVRSRAAKKPADEKKAIDTKGRRDNLERNTQAAKDAAGVKAGTGSRPAVTEAKAGSTLETIRKIKSERNYTYIGH